MLSQLKNYSVIKTMAGIFDTTQDEPHPQQLPRMERIVIADAEALKSVK